MVILSITREIQIIHSDFALIVALIFIGKIYISVKIWTKPTKKIIIKSNL